MVHFDEGKMCRDGSDFFLNNTNTFLFLHTHALSNQCRTVQGFIVANQPGGLEGEGDKDLR